MIRGEIVPSTPYGIIAALLDRITDKAIALMRNAFRQPEKNPCGFGLAPVRRGSRWIRVVL